MVFSLFILSIIVLFFEINIPFENIIFEMVSAIGNNGLSTGITKELNEWSKIIVVFTMFLGRFGPLTLILLLAGKTTQPSYNDSEERIKIG
jgi:trk system potassium uptake protein TrkH